MLDKEWEIDWRWSGLSAEKMEAEGRGLAGRAEAWRRHEEEEESEDDYHL